MNEPYHGHEDSAHEALPDDQQLCVHDWVGDEACAYCKLDVLRAAAIYACHEMGCFCPEDTHGHCPMCKLEHAING